MECDRTPAGCAFKVPLQVRRAMTIYPGKCSTWDCGENVLGKCECHIGVPLADVCDRHTTFSLSSEKIAGSGY